MYTLKTYPTISDIEPSAWNSIVPPGRMICSHEFLLAVEQAHVNDCRFYYTVIFDQERIIAHTCFYYIQTELDLFAKGIIKRIIAGIRNRFPGFMILNSLECGTPVALGSTISQAENIQTDCIIPLFVKEAERLAHNLNINILLFRDFYENETEIIEQLAKNHYKKVRNLSCATMKVRWTNYREYLAAMRSTYRYRLKKRTRQAKRPEISHEIVEDFEQYVDILEQLWRNSYDHAQEYRREIITADFFRAINRLLPDHSRILLIKHHDTPAAFALLLHDGPVLDWLFCGLDYALNRSFCIYFNLLYLITEYGITHGFKEINYGITTLIPKMDIGAEATPLLMYMKHLKPSFNCFIPALFDRLSAPADIPARRIFRDIEQK